jgi:hypothetical protein
MRVPLSAHVRRPLWAAQPNPIRETGSHPDIRLRGRHGRIELEKQRWEIAVGRFVSCELALCWRTNERDRLALGETKSMKNSGS